MLNNKPIEITWLIVTVLALFTFLHALIFKGIKDSIPFFVIFVLSLLIYFTRRTRRLKKNCS